jgi:8-oxo-dGTP diphosphatase
MIAGGAAPADLLPVRHKVFAYITHGDRLLLLAHPQAPEAGIQVPAGTLEPGESPEAGALREAWEETGLPDLTLVRFLGEQRRDMRDFDIAAVHQRYFFHLRCGGDPPARWRHWEAAPSDGSAGPIEFELYWARLAGEIPPLMADHDWALPQLRAAMDARACSEGAV